MTALLPQAPLGYCGGCLVRKFAGLVTPFTFLLLSTTMRLGVLSLLPGPSFLLMVDPFLVRPTALSAISLLVAPAVLEPNWLAAGGTRCH